MLGLALVMSTLFATTDRQSRQYFNISSVYRVYGLCEKRAYVHSALGSYPRRQRTRNLQSWIDPCPGL